jgi:hypothetical protein
MTTMKSIISNGISTALTTVYTNSSGADAALKAFNVNLPGTGATASTGGSDWTMLGDTIPFAYAQLAARAQVPQVIRLSTDRILFIYTNYGKTASGSGAIVGQAPDTVMTQIVEYQTNKYVAGPIVPIAIPSNTINSSVNPTKGSVPTSAIKGIALTPTKVALVISATNGTNTLMNLNIVGNQVSQTTYSFALTSEFGDNRELCIAPVVDNTSKVVIFGSNTANTLYHFAAYNITGSNTPTLAGSAFNTTTTAYTNPSSCAMCQLRRSDNTYYYAGFTSASAVSAGIVTFVDATNTFTLVNQNTLTLAITAQYNRAMQVGCASNGTDYSACLVIPNNAASNINAWVQNSGTTVVVTASSSPSTNNGSLNNSFYNAINWGNQKVVFVGSTLTYYTFTGNGTSGGTFTNGNIGTNPSVSTSYPMSWFAPFDSRPLYTYQSNTANPVQLLARTGGTATGYGSTSTTGNYLPLGQPTGKHYQWSDLINGYIVAYGPNLYALDSTGVIQAEKAASGTYLGGTTGTIIKTLAITQNGKLYYGSDDFQTSAESGKSINESMASTNAYVGYSTSLITSAASLASLTVTNTSTSSTARASVDTIAWTDSTGVDNGCVAYAFSSGGTVYLGFNNGPNLATTSNSGFSSFPTGNPYYGNPIFALMWVAPPSTTNPNGLVVALASNYLNYTYSTYNALNVTTTPFDPASSTSPLGSTTTIDSTSNYSTAYQRVIVERNAVGFSVAAYGNQTNNTIYTMVNNNKTTKFGTTTSTGSAVINSVTTTGLDYPDVSANKGLAVVAANSDYGTAYIPKAYVYTSSTTIPYATYTGNTSSPYISTTRTGSYTSTLYGSGLTYIVASNGTYPINVMLTVSSLTTDFYVTGNAGTSLTNASNRSNDVYYIPNGYSVKVQADNANVADVLLTVLEQ